MKQDRVIGFVVVLAAGIGAAVLAAHAQRGFTGTPADIINVKVTNNQQYPVPTVIQEINPNARPLRVTVDPSAVLKVEITRPQWEYKQVTIRNLDEISTILNTEGAGGWEATGVTSTTPGGTIVVLKRIK